METQTEIQLPEFTGVFLIPREYRKAFPQADILQGDFGEAILESYNALVKEDFNDNKYLKFLEYEDGLVKGSNSPSIVLLNKILREIGLLTATQADLENILRLKAFNLKGTYVDTALALRSAGEPNSYLAQDLIAQLGNQVLPVMIPLNGLELRMDEKSPYGLAFNLTESTQKIYAPILNKGSGYFSSADIDEKTGLTKNIGEGNRYHCNRSDKSGLVGVYLVRDLDAGADDEHLGVSDDDGRVVVVSAEGAQKNFAVVRKIIDENYQTQLRALDEKRINAEKAVRDIMFDN